MTIDYTTGADGIATLTWNMADAPMNVLNERSMAAFGEAARKAVADPQVKGVIITKVDPNSNAADQAKAASLVQ